MASDNQTFVANLFRDLYYRDALTVELGHYTDQLTSGFTTRAQVASEFLNSPQYTGGIESLIRLYQACFDRTPDYNGLMYWNGVKRGGASLTEIANIFSKSPEFVERYGSNLSNANYVKILYANVLGRDPDSGGEAYWNFALSQGINRGHVLASFAESKELKEKMSADSKIVTSYAILAERAPTNTELSTAPTELGALLVSAMSNATSELTWSATGLQESSANDGSFSQTLSIKLVGGTFKGLAGASLGTITNIPTGLTASLTKVSDIEAKLALVGKATAHAASNSIANLTVRFTAADFQTGALPSNAAKSDLKVEFIDLFSTVSGQNLAITVYPIAALTIDLTRDSVTHGTTKVVPLAGLMSSVQNVDLSGISTPTVATPGVSVTFIGGTEDNTYKASPVGDTIRAGGGDDTLYLGTGIDKVVLPSAPVSNEQVEIVGFKPGSGGDILNVSGFLVSTKTANLTPVDSDAAAPGTPKAWANGDILMVIGDLNETNIAALFGTQFANPTSARKAVVLTADVTGDTKIWYLTNTTGVGVTSITAGEIMLVGTLVGVNNLELAGFVAGNFA